LFNILIIDSFSKYAWANLLPIKEGKGIAMALEELFDTVGQPGILQADNGGEFLGDVTIYNLRKKKPKIQKK